MAKGGKKGNLSKKVAKAAPRHAQGIKSVPRDAMRVCFEPFLGLVPGGGSGGKGTWWV